MERRTEASQDVQAAARHPRILGYRCQCSGHLVYKMVQMSYLATFARECPCVEFRDSGLSVRSFGLSVLFRPWSLEIWGTTVPLAWPLRATRPTAPTTSMVAPPHSAFVFSLLFLHNSGTREDLSVRDDFFDARLITFVGMLIAFGMTGSCVACVGLLGCACGAELEVNSWSMRKAKMWWPASALLKS